MSDNDFAAITADLEDWSQAADSIAMFEKHVAAAGQFVKQASEEAQAGLPQYTNVPVPLMCLIGALHEALNCAHAYMKLKEGGGNGDQ